MAVYALVFFSCILLSSATSLVDPNEVAENQFDGMYGSAYKDCLHILQLYYYIGRIIIQTPFPLLLLELRELPIPVKYTRREVEQNCDYLGRDFKSEFNTSGDKCRTLCKEDSRCSHYVWAKLGGLNKCFLKDIKVWEDSTPLADAECGFIISRIKWTKDELLGMYSTLIYSSIKDTITSNDIILT